MKRTRSLVLECLAGIAIVAPISVATLSLAAAPEAPTLRGDGLEGRRARRDGALAATGCPKLREAAHELRTQ